MFSELSGRDAELLLHRARANLRYHFPLLGGEGRADNEPWSRDDVDAFAWIAGLAKSGHWGAELVVKVAMRDRLAMCYVAQSHRALAAELAERSTDVAFVAALAECRRPGPDWNCVEDWLEKGGFKDLARGLREARRTLGRLKSNDVWTIDHAIMSSNDGGELLLELSRWHGLEMDGKGAVALLDAACRIGCRKALAQSLADACYGKPDEPQALLAWMKTYEAVVPAEEAREVLRLAAPLTKPELERLKALVAQPPAPGGILLEIAQGRAGGDPEVAARLLDRAYELCEERALELHWRMNRPRSGPLGVFLAEWLKRFPKLELDATQRFRVAVLLETGSKERGIAPDLPTATRIYESAARADHEDSPSASRLAFYVGVRLDPRKRYVIVPLPELALRWYVRGIDAGSAMCFDEWLLACCEGAGVKPDPAEALAMAKRWQAGGGPGAKMSYSSGLAAACKIASDCLRGNPALARRWLQVGELLDYAPAKKLLAEMGNQGQ